MVGWGRVFREWRLRESYDVISTLYDIIVPFFGASIIVSVTVTTYILLKLPGEGVFKTGK